MRSTITVLILVLGLTSHAQIGINNPNPDTTSVLDMKYIGNPKGVLVPRMDSLQRQSITNPGNGLLVFDTQYRQFFFYDQTITQWKAINPWDFQPDSKPSIYVQTRNVGIGTNVPSEKLEVVGNIKADTVKVNAIQTTQISVPGFPSNALVPAGIIVMWSGNPSNIPLGWGLCDGSNGTPDLQSRFIVGACCDSGSFVPAGMYAAKTIGGADQVALSPNQLPAHNHNFSGNTNFDGAHTHSFRGNDIPTNSFNGVARAQGNWTFTADVAGTQGQHSHAFSGTTDGGIGLTGQAHENRPRFFALAYIMKLP